MLTFDHRHQAHFWFGITSLLGNISPCFRRDHCSSYTLRAKGMAFKSFSVGLHFLTSVHAQNRSIFVKRISTRSFFLKLGWKRADSYTTAETCHWICSWRGGETEPFSWEAASWKLLEGAPGHKLWRPAVIFCQRASAVPVTAICTLSLTHGVLDSIIFTVAVCSELPSLKVL